MVYRFNPINPGTPIENAIAVINNNFGQLDNETVTKVFKGSGGKPSFVQGRLPNDLGEGILLNNNDGVPLIAAYVDKDGNPVLKVAKTGNDATTASNDQLIFNSSQNILKVVASGSRSTVVNTMTPASTTTLTVPHNLGVVPAFQTYVTLPNTFPTNYAPTGVIGMPAMAIIRDSGGAGVILVWVSSRADTTNLYLDITNPTTATITGPHNFSFKYYILQETAA